MIADYDKVGPFTNDAPPAVDADAFDQFEDGIDAVTTEAQRLAGDPALPNVPIDHEATLRSGAWTVMGSDGAFDSTHEYMIAYFGGGLYWDGSLWQCAGGAQGNGWTVIGIHADGDIFIYGDTSTGTGTRTYSAAAFMALRRGAIPSTPATFFEDGTIDGQTIVWNDGAGVWEVGTIDIPSTIKDTKTTTTSLGPSATGTIDGLNGEFTLAAGDLGAVGDVLRLVVQGTSHNQTGSPRTFTFTPKLQGLDLNLAQAISFPNNASVKAWKAVVEVMRTGADTVRSTMVVTTPNNVVTTTYGAQSGLNFAATAALLFNLNQTISDADLEHAVTAARYEVV